MDPFGDGVLKNGSPITPAIPMPGWKRALDIGCCLVAMPVLGLCTLVTVFVMKITSPGPVFSGKNASVIEDGDSCAISFVPCWSALTAKLTRPTAIT
jgi:hypothetical protein